MSIAQPSPVNAEGEDPSIDPETSMTTLASATAAANLDGLDDLLRTPGRAEFVAAAYRRILRREPDFWGAARFLLAPFYPRKRLLRRLLNSDEYRGLEGHARQCQEWRLMDQQRQTEELRDELDRLRRRGDAPSGAALAAVQGSLMLLHEPHVDRVISPILRDRGVWEPFETELVKGLIRPGDVVLDVGANIGYYTLLFSRLIGERGFVFAFEPDPANFQLLGRNLEINGSKNVSAVPLAVGDKDGPGRLFLCGDNPGDHRMHDGGEGRPAVAVQCVSLDEYFRRHTGLFNFLKIDVQGSEWAVFQGMRNLLAKHDRFKAITEFWPFGLSRCGVAAADYLGLLRDLGFSLFEVNEDTARVTPADPAALLDRFPVETQTFTNLLGVLDRAASPLTVPVATPEPAAVEQRRARWRAGGDLRGFERRASSQNGEDGILEEILRRVGPVPPFFVEFGVESGVECNCARLVVEEGWAGLFLEADESMFAALRERYRGRTGVQTVCSCVSSANIEDLLRGANVPEEFGVLSIDIDGNDYWVWKAIRGWRPCVVVMEYNGAYPPPRKWVMKENPEHRWRGDTYYGASLASLAALGGEKGYTLVGTDSRGVNAFFVRDDLVTAGRFLDPATLYHFSPPAFGTHNGGHPPGDGPFVEI
jgi:FkbM family methyltransferase